MSSVCFHTNNSPYYHNKGLFQICFFRLNLMTEKYKICLCSNYLNLLSKETQQYQRHHSRRGQEQLLPRLYLFTINKSGAKHLAGRAHLKAANQNQVLANSVNNMMSINKLLNLVVKIKEKS